MTQPAPENRLALETSPYLLQHAHNPVDWHPWGEEAFALARSQARPILLSVGYAACHWCHVMERESFTSPEVAAVLNRHFVAIKVDREERPDVDAVYMAATQAMNGGRGGWPMTVLLTPEREPFFAGTYLPPHSHGGALGFVPLLQHVANLWRDAPDQLRQDATELTQFLRRHHAAPTGAAAAAPEGRGWAVPVAEAACEAAAEGFDAAFGGFGAPPKFLATPTLRLLLRCSAAPDARPLRAMVQRSLLGMARGGLWDWVAGGFSRYSTDAAWQVPHFEKMGYDNALMVQLLLEAYQVDGDARWASLAVQTLRFADAELGLPGGGFASAIDADSEGEEGRFSTWTYEEAQAALPLDEGDRAAWLAALGVQPAGNWENGRNVLFAAGGLAPRPADADTVVAALADVAAPACASAPAWPEVRAHLARARTPRVRPLTDDKVLAGHNGLMVEAFARAAAVLGELRYLTRACAAADFVCQQLVRPDGLRRTWRGVTGDSCGVLEDYAYLSRGLIALYEAGAPAHYLKHAQRLADCVDTAFAEPQSGVLFDSAHGEHGLLFRPRTEHDGATPSPAAAMAWSWRRLAWHMGDETYAALSVRTVAALQRAATRHPESHATLLALGLDEAQAPVQVSWLGSGEPLASPLWRAAHAFYLPHAVFAHGATEPETVGDAAAEPRWPLLAGKPAGAGPNGALYVCADARCSPPLTRVDEVREALLALVPHG